MTLSKLLLLGIRRSSVFVLLAIVCILSIPAAFLLRFDFGIPASEYSHLLIAILIAAPIKFLVLVGRRAHSGWWGPASVPDLHRLAMATTLGGGMWSGMVLASIGLAFPRSIYLIDTILTFMVIAGIRILLRILREASVNDPMRGSRKAVLIYGAGWAGTTLAREILSNSKLNMEVVGFLDDDPQKLDERVMYTLVRGGGKDAKRLAEEFIAGGRPLEEVLIAMPAATGKQMRNAIAHCRAAGVNYRTLPGLGDLLLEKGLTRQIRDVSVEDLLGREPVELDEKAVRAALAGECVLVTGAAGSIGSELCRQIAALNPDRLLIMDQSESGLFHIDMELRSKYPELDITTELADIRDARRVQEVLRRSSVHSVFHAAAYKHVPMLEQHVMEATCNNIIGTWNLVQAAADNGVRSFLMISTDKAVNPSSFMGATKRVAELIVNSFSQGRNGMKCSSVRFGNVLGSNGSVVPIFKAQIAAGGPVTVTDPEMRRYFMTIREAVQLVLQASTIGKESEIFVLDMGEPVKILDLARNIIKLSGLTPDEDVQIRFTGLRPGEKLYEELLADSEKILPTHHPKIKVFKGSGVGPASVHEWFSELRTLLRKPDSASIVRHVRVLVPEYRPGTPVISPVEKEFAGSAGLGSGD